MFYRQPTSFRQLPKLLPLDLPDEPNPLDLPPIPPGEEDLDLEPEELLLLREDLVLKPPLLLEVLGTTVELAVGLF